MGLDEMRLRYLSIIAAAAITACGKQPQKAAQAPAEPGRALSENEQVADIQADKNLTAEQKDLLTSQVPEFAAQDRQEENDRSELVQPPPSGWKPENAKRKLKLTLLSEKTMIRKDEPFRYRLEVQNVGREAVSLVELVDSFIKSGNIDGLGPFELYVTPPGGKEQRLWRPWQDLDGAMLPLGKEITFPGTMTAAEKEAAFERMNLESAAAGQLSLRLKPGETLSTRPESRRSRFRDLRTRFTFDKPGTYRIRAVYNNAPPKPLTEAQIQRKMRAGQSRDELMQLYREMAESSLGAVGSNTVTLEVMP